MQYSDLAAKQVARGATRPETVDYYGRVRVAVIDTKVAAADTNITLCKFPAGRIRILGATSFITATFATGGTTAKIGYTAYAEVGGAKIVADDDAFLAATAGSAITSKPLATLVINSDTGFDLVVNTSANLAANDTIKGVVQFVID